jgi:midasin (ATPase involved in ribosome maturation)
MRQSVFDATDLATNPTSEPFDAHRVDTTVETIGHTERVGHALRRADAARRTDWVRSTASRAFIFLSLSRCGKTSICEILAQINEQQLFTVNCHTGSESADFLGSIRPMRRVDDEPSTDEKRGLFEWQDGALISAMKQGGLFLIDEISLADDSVLERLNSVLEPEKQLVLAEKGYQDDQQQIDTIEAHARFRLVATMNPGGDFGKKEVRTTSTAPQRSARVCSSCCF